MAITINSRNLYTESGVQLPNTGIKVFSRSGDRDETNSISFLLTLFVSQSAKDNGFAKIRRLFFGANLSVSTEINLKFTKQLTRVEYRDGKRSVNEVYIKNYLETALGVGTVTIT